MDAFITLREAATTLAGDRATQEAVEIWASLLAEQAIQLKIIKAWTTSTEAIPGGVSFARHRDEWCIPYPAFNAWRETNGFTEQARPKEDGPAQQKKTPEQRRRRLCARRDELKRQGVRAWLKALAAEEGVNAARIKQILQEPQSAAPFRLNSWPLHLRSTKTRTS